MPASFPSRPAIALLAIVAFSSAARAQVPADQSAKLLKPADGLDATLWASEPMVVNPTNMDIDSRGRVWVSEGQNYRYTHGGGAKFPRVPSMPTAIKILEDTDGDGKADKVTVFADKIWPDPDGPCRRGATTPRTASTLGSQGLHVGNSPDILVFEDTDGDDKADKRYPAPHRLRRGRLRPRRPRHDPRDGR